jgi:uncharacterized protein (UPF0548 family)
VLRLLRASEDEKRILLAAAREAPSSTPQMLTVVDGRLGRPPKGFVHDFSRSGLGKGLRAFDAAREAFRRWEQFDLGWVRVANSTPRIAPGELVAVEAHTVCFWSINLSRVVEVVDSPTRFGFMYATTEFHVEEGQERFVIDFDSASESVSYLIEAISRPRNLLTRIGYPFTRAAQHRFAKDSHARMRRSVLDRLGASEETPKF